MIIGKPLPFVGSFVDAIHEAIEVHHPGHGLSAIQRAWLAFCLTALLVTNSVCWARFARASLGTYSLAALSWMFRHAKMPWELLLAASVRILLRHYGITHGSLVVDDTEKKRSKSAKQIAYLHKLLQHGKAQHPTLTVRCIIADALYGSAAFMDGAAALFHGVQVISQLRSNQKVCMYTREYQVADYFATHPGTLQQMRVRGGDEVAAIVGSARMYVSAHRTKRFVIALQYAGEEAYRYLMASDLSWRTMDIVHAQTLRWLVEVFVQDWKGYEGWGTLTKQPGEEGSRRSLILSLLVDHCLFFHPAQHAQLRNNLPAYTVGSLRAHVQLESLVHVMQEIVLSDDPQGHLQRFTQAVHETFAFGRSKKHLVQRELGRLEPTPYLKYRAREVMRNVTALSS